MNALEKLPLRRMTIPEFLAWADEQPEFWQLRDGEPEMMAPAADRHGSIQHELAVMIGLHLRQTGRPCRGTIAPGVVPRLRSDRNMLVPDIGITCSPASSGVALPDPIVLIEILSPSNEAQTRANVWAFTTIPTVAEIVVINSVDIAAEVLRRLPNGDWPGQPELIGADGTLRLDSIGFEAPLRDVYRTAGLTG